MIKLNIGLEQGRFAELEESLYQVSTPGHPRYGKHLSEEEVRELARPSDEALGAVKDWLSSHGVNDVSYSKAKDWIKVTLPVAKVEHMLGAEYSVYTHEDGEELVRTPQWSLPRHLHEHIATIQPTTSFFRPRAQARRALASETFTLEHVAARASDAMNSSVAAVCNSTLLVTPDCLRTLYGTIGYEPHTMGDKNYVAINNFLDEVTIRSDAQLYALAYRPDIIKSVYQFSRIPVANGTRAGTLSEYDLKNGIGIEGNLDAQTMLGVAAPVPFIVFTTNGTDPSFKPDAFTTTDTDEPYVTWLQYVLDLPDDGLPSVVSTSYGDDEQTISYAYASQACKMFAQLGARGVSLMFAAGDYGVGPPGYCVSNNGTNATTFLPQFPASCPYVTAVGATMHVNPEVAAYDPHYQIPFVSGGGFSYYFPRPSYQDPYVPEYLSKYVGNDYAGLYNPNGRGYPDLAAQGSNFTIYWNGSLLPVSGTSASTPTMSAVLALVNDALVGAGKPVLGFLNPWLYSIGRKAFTDITIGASIGCNTSGFPAEPGWDAVTGWGTPLFKEILKLEGVEWPEPRPHGW